ncbi:MAG: acyl-CoA dehydrogenase family protein [Acidimicrobiales bacterium]
MATGTVQATHSVFNQATPLVGHNPFALDVALREGVVRHGASWALEQLEDFGATAGEEGEVRRGELANEHPPVLHRFDRFGNRVDRVEYHPAYHELMTSAVAAGVHAAPWADERAGAHVARAAKFAIRTHVECGHLCPISMTYAVIPALRVEPSLAAVWEPRLVSRRYDPADEPAAGKAGAVAGMAMTEKQGGSDVRASTTRAEAVSDGYVLTGHKWFCSAPMSDLFLMLAQTAAGLSCFAVPRWLPDGTRNAIAIERLKDKLGNRSNASSEIELHGASGALVGDEGAGITTIIRMVNHTRLDCIIGATGQMRAAFGEACHHTIGRSAFGRRLVDQPLMRQVLADLAIESEAATVLMLRVAAAYDAAAGDDGAQAFARLATAVGKYWACKRNPPFTAEALECFGGNGYVETGPMARLFRESPLNGIWEGSGNVIALDVLRAIGREPGSLDAVLAEIALADGADTRFDRFSADLHAELASLAGIGAADQQRCARRLTERLALALQASLLLRYSTPAVADAFCAARLGGGGGLAFGTLPDGVDIDAVIARAWPPVTT